jgi:hypothetical protein
VAWQRGSVASPVPLRLHQRDNILKTYCNCDTRNASRKKAPCQMPCRSRHLTGHKTSGGDSLSSPGSPGRQLCRRLPRLAPYGCIGRFPSGSRRRNPSTGRSGPSAETVRILPSEMAFNVCSRGQRLLSNGSPKPLFHSRCRTGDPRSGTPPVPCSQWPPYICQPNGCGRDACHTADRGLSSPSGNTQGTPRSRELACPAANAAGLSFGSVAWFVRNGCQSQLRPSGHPPIPRRGPLVC